MALARCSVVMRNLRSVRLVPVVCVRAMSTGDLGSGAGKGGGTGGSIRESGGAFGRMEAAREEEYFRRLEKEKLANLRHHLEDEVLHHESEVRRLQDEITRHKKKIDYLKSQAHKD